MSARRTRQPAAWQREFVERVAAQADMAAMPPSMVRVFAWLIVCDPPEQSVDDIRAALQLSSGAISAATTTLIRMGVTERVHQPGDRRFHYRMRTGGWSNVIRQRHAATAEVRATADRALARAPKPQPRLREMRDFYRWLEDALGALGDGPG